MYYVSRLFWRVPVLVEGRLYTKVVKFIICKIIKVVPIPITNYYFIVLGQSLIPYECTKVLLFLCSFTLKYVSQEPHQLVFVGSFPSLVNKKTQQIRTTIYFLLKELNEETLPLLDAPWEPLGRRGFHRLMMEVVQPVAGPEHRTSTHRLRFRLAPQLQGHGLVASCSRFWVLIPSAVFHESALTLSFIIGW